MRTLKALTGTIANIPSAGVVGIAIVAALGLGIAAVVFLLGPFPDAAGWMLLGGFIALLGRDLSRR